MTDATAELVRHRFECKQGMVESELSAAEFELGIRSTWYASRVQEPKKSGRTARMNHAIVNILYYEYYVS